MAGERLLYSDARLATRGDSGERVKPMSNLKIVRFTLGALALSGLAAPAIAQQPPPPLTMKQLKPDVWAGLGGAGGNSTIIIGKTGVIVVDAKQTEAGAKDLLAEIAKITPKPVTTAIITHSDGDHVNGLVAFPAGIKIIAHENNKKEQEAALAAGGRGAPPADRLPNQVVTKNKETMTIDGVKLELYHWAPAHTSGDLDGLPAGREDRRHGRHRRDEPRRRQSKRPLREERLDRRLARERQGHDRTQRRDVCDRARRPAHESRPPAETDRDDGAARQDCRDGEGRQDARRDQGRAARRSGPGCCSACGGWRRVVALRVVALRVVSPELADRVEVEAAAAVVLLRRPSWKRHTRSSRRSSWLHSTGLDRRGRPWSWS